MKFVVDIRLDVPDEDMETQCIAFLYQELEFADVSSVIPFENYEKELEAWKVRCANWAEYTTIDLSKANSEKTEIEEVCQTCNGIKYIRGTKSTPDKQCPECKGRGLTLRAADAGCDVCRDGVPGWDEEWLFCPYCGSTLRR